MIVVRNPCGEHFRGVVGKRFSASDDAVFLHLAVGVAAILAVFRTGISAPRYVEIDTNFCDGEADAQWFGQCRNLSEVFWSPNFAWRSYESTSRSPLLRVFFWILIDIVASCFLISLIGDPLRCRLL